MTKEERISGFASLKQALLQLDKTSKHEIFQKAADKNPWFTPLNIEKAINGISNFLEEKTIIDWLNKYNLPHEPKKIGIVMAGNIPLVGFHDFMSVILAGHIAVIKLSSQDQVLLKALLAMLTELNPKFSKQFLIVDKLLKVDAVIATGSDNSSRYFKKYFKDIPHIIRKNRTSVAVLSGSETKEELMLLGNDIFSFFGLGCRNVAKVYVPEGYNMKILLGALEGHHDVINHPKYFNNYEYNKAIFLVNRVDHLDTGFALFTQNVEIVSPLAVIYYEEYSNLQQLNNTLQSHASKLQCIVSNTDLETAIIPFGKSQILEIDDYADNVDTMAFLCKI